MTDLTVICVCGHPRRHHYGREWTGTCIAMIGDGSVCGCLTFEALDAAESFSDGKGERADGP